MKILFEIAVFFAIVLAYATICKIVWGSVKDYKRSLEADNTGKTGIVLKEEKQTRRKKMEIKQKFNFVDGTFNTETDEMVCVASEKHCSVRICLKGGGWNIPIGEIKLYSKDLYVDAKEVFADAAKLGEEIARRWNSNNDKK